MNRTAQMVAGFPTYNRSVPATYLNTSLLAPAVGRRRLLIGALGAGLLSATAGCNPAARSTVQRPWGAFLPSVQPIGSSSRDPLDQLASLSGARAAYVHRFASVGDSAPISDLDTIHHFGATPLLTLEPWAPMVSDQTRYSMAQIAAGSLDDDLRRWGTSLANWRHPLLLRFAQEMNGTWYPWSVDMSGNTGADFRAAWARMHSVLRAQGAKNVRFVWAPNVVTTGASNFENLFPGHDRVDYLGLDGYNWGDVAGRRWQSASELFVPSLRTLRSLDPDHPILITEVASAEGPDPTMKAQWIRDFFAIVESDSQIAGFVWFQMDKERDWRFNSTPASTEAFRSSLAGMTRRYIAPA